MFVTESMKIILLDFFHGPIFYTITQLLNSVRLGHQLITR